MKRIIAINVVWMLFLTTASNAQEAQTPNSPAGGSQSFLLTGTGSTIFTASKDGNTFMPMTLMLMPLAKINDRLFLESGVKMELGEDGNFAFNLEVLNLHYRLNPWMSIHFGKFPANWGNILDMFGEGFVSRFPTTPIGLSDDGMAPTDQVGFGIQGGIQTGMSKMLYDIYISNGPQLIIEEDGGMTGHMSYDSFTDNNKNKAVGGKIGFLPFPNSSLQIDVFGQTAAKTGDSGSEYENIGSNSYGVDFNYYKTFNPIMVRIMGQYEATKTQKATFTMTDGPDYTFNNKGDSWYLASTLRPIGAQNRFVSNLELGGRYVNYTPPKNAPWGGDTSTQFTLDLTYWFTWSSQLSLGYDDIKEGSEATKSFVVRGLYKF